MSAGNTLMEARTQAPVRNLRTPHQVPHHRRGPLPAQRARDVIARYPHIAAGIRGLREAGFGILVKDASLGGQYPGDERHPAASLDQGCFASFGAHRAFEVALERALTELLQGRRWIRWRASPRRGLIKPKSPTHEP